jgi:UDP-N-acetylmuramate--alanine ligase
VEYRDQLLDHIRPHLTDNCVLLLMGARDPSLEGFAKKIWCEL